MYTLIYLIIQQPAAAETEPYSKCAATPKHVTVEGKRVLHLDALCFEDEFGHQRWDVGLVEDGVGHTLQQRLHWSHTVHDDTPAQETVVKQQKHHSWTHLRHRQMYDHCSLSIHHLHLC